MPITLKERFRRRDSAFKKSTDKILEMIPNVLDGITDFLRIQEDEGKPDVRWEDIMYFADAEPPTVMLITVISYPPGSEFMMPNGEVIKVTDVTVDYFRRMIRFGIPMDVVTNASRKEIAEFLKKTAEEDEDIVAVPNLDSETLAANVATDGFDLDELTEEQRKTLELFNDRIMKE